MKSLSFGILFLAGLLALPAPAAAQAKPEVWRVAFDDEGTEFRKALLGTLELRDGVLRFTADNRSIRWAIDLADLKHVVQSQGYGEDSNSVLIESLSGEQLYVAILDKRFLYGSPKKALRVVDAALRLPLMRAARAERAARYAERVAAADAESGDEGDGKGEKGGGS